MFGDIVRLSPESMVRLRKAVYGFVNTPNKWWDRLKRSLLKHGITSCALDPCAFVLIKQSKVRGSTGVHVDDLLGEGDEVFDGTILEVTREFDVGAWDVGAMRFKARQLTQMANYEIMIDVERYKHDLSQIEVPKEDKLKFERVLHQQKK